jgi:hypothetical protein
LQNYRPLGRPCMDQRYLRVALAIEFLIALIAVYTVWSQLGGQGHLDLVPWSWKLGLGLGTAYAIVRATAAAARDEKAWNGRTVRWISVILTMASVAALLTFYEHMFEAPPEEEGIEESEEMTSRGPGVNEWLPLLAERRTRVHVKSSPY